MNRLVLYVLFVWLSPCLAYCQAPTASQIREMISGEITAFNIPPEPVHKIENKTVWTGSDSIKIRLYYPDANKKHRIIYNIHGGALVAGDLETHDNISRVLATKCNAIVIALDYRKPPEAPYPAGLDDCTAVLGWIRANAASFGGQANNILVLGDSGGGLLAASMQIRLQKTFIPSALILVNPAVDLRSAQNPVYQLVAKWYLNGKNASDAVISPILADNVSFFPPTLIITCQKDELMAQAVDFRNKLAHAGVKTQWLDLPGQDHLGGQWAANHPQAQKAVMEAVRFINSIPKR